MKRTQVGKGAEEHTATEEPIRIPSEADLSPAAALYALPAVVTGILVGLGERGEPMVDYPTNVSGTPVLARSLVVLDEAAIGKEVAFVFENGDPLRLLIVGVIQPCAASAERVPFSIVNKDSRKLTISVEDTLVLRADKQIELRCGEASITLTAAGKVLVRGAYILTRSSGVNRIKGAAVQIN